MSKFTPEHIASLRALAERATPRPWYLAGDWCIHDKRTKYDASGIRIGETANRIAATDWDSGDRQGANAALIVTAANNFEPMLDEIERLQTTNREMKSQLDIATDLGQKRFEEISILQKRLEKAEKDRDDWRRLSCENKAAGMGWMERADKFELCLKEIVEQAECRTANWYKKKAEQILKGGEE